MITKERKKELQEERKLLNVKINQLAQERIVLGNEQRKCKVRGWRIREIMKGEIKDE